MGRDWVTKQAYERQRTEDAPPRHILVLMDGTWNDENGKQGSGLVTNVVKLFKSLREDPEHQIVRYFRGVGNDDDYSWWRQLTGGAFARDEERIRLHAFSTIAREYRDGDFLSIFGFSRGAASARMLAGMVGGTSAVKGMGGRGLPEKITVETCACSNRTSRAFENRFESFDVPSDAQVTPAPVSFLGVWETVGAFGIPVKLFGIPFDKMDLFKDMSVSAAVQKAVHIVGVDETRDPYWPVLMNQRPGDDAVEEVWFPGVHSDIGGSYAEDYLAKLTLSFMVERLNAHMQGIEAPPVLYDQPTLDAYTDVRETTPCLHFHGLGYKKSIREIKVQGPDGKGDPSRKPRLHSSVVALRESREVHSVVGGKPAKRKQYRIQYHPPNVKALEDKQGLGYELVP